MKLSGVFVWDFFNGPKLWNISLFGFDFFKYSNIFFFFMTIYQTLQLLTVGVVEMCKKFDLILIMLSYIALLVSFSRQGLWILPQNEFFINIYTHLRGIIYILISI